MQKLNYLVVAAMLALGASSVLGQDDGEVRIRKALEGRQILLKMDLPAIDAGIPMIFDDANVSYDEAAYKKLVKEYGVAIPRDSRARITGVRITNKGIEIDLDGGGLPGRDWFIGNVKLVPPDTLGKSDREVELERQISLETNPTNLNFLKSELEFEQRARVSQDQRNQEAYQRMTHLRSKYIEDNRKSWGSKLIIVVHSRKASVTMREMVKSLSKYAELLPRETTGQ